MNTGAGRSGNKMQRDLELEYDEIIFGLTLDSLRFSYAKNIPVFYTDGAIDAPPIYDFVDPKIRLLEYKELKERVALLGLDPAKTVQSARLEDCDILKIVTTSNLVIKIKFNKLWLTSFGASELEGMPPEFEKVECNNLVADRINVRSGLYHDFWELETDGDNFVKKIVFELSNRFFYKNIDNKKDCVALSYIKDDDLSKFEYSELAAKMKVASFMKNAGIKGRWDKTNGYYKIIKLESVCRLIYPSYKLIYKNLPRNVEMLYNVPVSQLKESLYGEIEKLCLQRI